MNEFLAAAPQAEVAHGALGCMVSLNDLADRPPRPLADGEVIELGGKRVRHLDTPHVPHGWEARVLYEETTGTLLCGDLFTHLGNGPGRSPPTTSSTPADQAEDMFRATCLTPSTGPDDPPPGRARPDDAGAHARLVVHRRLRRRAGGVGRRVRSRAWPGPAPR